MKLWNFSTRDIVSRTTTTDAYGIYRFDDIEPGTYSVTVAAAGFQGSTFGFVRVTDSTEIELDAVLRVA